MDRDVKGRAFRVSINSRGRWAPRGWSDYDADMGFDWDT